jgi:uncharacterized protein with HEPN domain
MTPRQIEDYLQDILDSISASQQFIAGMSFEEFEADFLSSLAHHHSNPSRFVPL